MENIIKASALLFAGALLLTACNKYLEVEPDNRTALDTPEKVAQLLTSAYPNRDYICFSESMSDNAGDREHAGPSDVGDVRININAYRFVDYASDEKGSPDSYWKSCYKAIAAANQALEAIDMATNKAAYAPYKGEALLARAYAHFMLVTFFAKTYDSATAATDPGIPYVLKPEKDINTKYERKTVKYVYEMIEKDLTEGLPLINDRAYKVPAFHFNKAAANAFATRFYLFKRDYARVLLYAGKVFPGNNFKAYLRPLNTSFDKLTREERGAAFTSPDTKANLLLATTLSVWARGYNDYQFGLNSKIAVDLFFSENITKKSNDPYNTGPYKMYYWGSNTNDRGTEKFLENFVYTSADIGFPYIYVPLLTAEEVLFNHAEANARTGDFGAALADLNTYYSTRMKNYDPATNNITMARVKTYYNMPNDSGNALIKAILDARRLEFMQEGMRWMDILRNKIPVIHAEANGDTVKIAADDPRRVLQIPQMAQSSGLAPNPR